VDPHSGGVAPPSQQPSGSGGTPPK
jgi:hypothetical protein